MKKQLWVIFLHLLVFGIFSGCTDIADYSETIRTPVITIGWVGPLSGPLGTIGQQHLQAWEQGSQHNALHIVIEAEDSQCDEQRAQLAAHRLIHIHKLPIVVGICEKTLTGMAPITEANKTLVLSPFARITPPGTPDGTYMYFAHPEKTIETQDPYDSFVMAQELVQTLLEYGIDPSQLQKHYLPGESR